MFEPVVLIPSKASLEQKLSHYGISMSPAAGIRAAGERGICVRSQLCMRSSIWASVTCLLMSAADSVQAQTSQTGLFS